MEEKKTKRRWPMLILVLGLAVLLGGGRVLYDKLARETPVPSPAAAAQTAEGTPSSAGETSAAPAPTPAAAPDFTVYDREGNPFSLSDFAGKPRVINFWATWCPPCRSELPDFDQAWRDFGGDVEFMMVALTDGERETPETVRSFLAEAGYGFPVYLDTDLDAAYTYGVRSIPTTVLVDGKGVMLAYRVGAVSGEALRSALDELIQRERNQKE